MAETSDLLTVPEAATLAGVSVRTMRRWATSGQVRTVGRGHKRRIVASELAATNGQPDRSPADKRPPEAATVAGAIEAAHLADLVRELQSRVADLAASAGMWQVRAEVLGHQLEQARGELRALKEPAPQEPREGALEGRRAAQAPDPSTETSTPWWRRWRAWAMIAL